MAVVVAQLLEQLLPTSEICGSNTVIGKIQLYSSCVEKTKIKSKEAWSGAQFCLIFAAQMIWQKRL